MNQAYLMHLASERLFSDYRIQFIEILNEIVLILTIYLIYCFTDYIQDPYTRATYVGSLMLLMTAWNMAINLAPVAIEIFKSMANKCRVKYQSCRNTCRRKASEKPTLSKKKSKQLVKRFSEPYAGDQI